MRIIYACLLLVTSITYSQTNLSEQVALEAKTEQEFFIAANEGDLINIKIKKTDGKKIPVFSFTALKSGNTVFTEKRFRKLKSSITSIEKSVYRLRFRNSFDKAVAFDMDISIDTFGKTPAKIVYKTVTDTVYGEEKTVMDTLETLETEILQKERFYLNSKSNALVKGGKNRVVFPVYLPENTKEWFYVLTADRDQEAVKRTAKTFSLASELSKHLDTEVTSLSSAVTQLNAPPGAHICDVYLLEKEQAQLFREKEDFSFNMEGSRENYKSGVIHIKENTADKFYIGVNNPDNLYGIHVGIEVVAIISKEEIVPKLIRTPEIHSREVPFAE
ncbi:hypothetical protein OOZ15_02885 [Galbibacter sp. EGI 63066]|uniref:hypothetical protein n=1 Tax=Galbibacter sp. EGI 63066 TaxID=2993559 RepID=UPI002248BE33|nr:hypothetical protein [Galbibacter sp. EGI 63066]MCX2678876.1 hypothetical protein [Galbibacter sp. EGI 63066]